MAFCSSSSTNAQFATPGTGASRIAHCGKSGGNRCGHDPAKFRSRILLPFIHPELDTFLFANAPMPLVKAYKTVSEQMNELLIDLSCKQLGHQVRTERREACLLVMRAITAGMNLLDWTNKLSISRLASITEMSTHRVEGGLKTLRVLGLLRVRKPKLTRHQAFIRKKKAEKAKQKGERPVFESTVHEITIRCWKLLGISKIMKAGAKVKRDILCKKSGIPLEAIPIPGQKRASKSTVIAQAVSKQAKEASGLPEDDLKSGRAVLDSLRSRFSFLQ